MQKFSFATAILVGCVIAIYCDAQTVPCGLADLPTDSSPENLLYVNPISDDVEEGFVVLKTKYFGNPRWADVDPNSDWPYMGGTYDSNGDYTMLANRNTSRFQADTNRSAILYFNNVYCSDSSITKYFFAIPIINNQTQMV